MPCPAWALHVSNPCQSSRVRQNLKRAVKGGKRGSAMVWTEGRLMAALLLGCVAFLILLVVLCRQCGKPELPSHTTPNSEEVSTPQGEDNSGDPFLRRRRVPTPWELEGGGRSYLP